MARTEITINSIPAWLAGEDMFAIQGDDINGNSVDLSQSPRLVLLAVNTGISDVDFTVELPASASTYNRAQSISHTVPATLGAVQSIRVIPLDSPSIAQPGNVLHIDSSDISFADVHFVAFTWAPTPR